MFDLLLLKITILTGSGEVEVKLRNTHSTVADFQFSIYIQYIMATIGVGNLEDMN